jgi:pteridine reductase
VSAVRPAVLITGAARRIGAALAPAFAHAGFDVAIHCNHSQSDAQAVQAQVHSLGAACEIFAHDLADIAGLPAFIQQVKQRFPALSTLVNNASVFERCEFLETTEAFFDQQHTINFKSPFFLTQAFVKACSGQKLSVVNMLDTEVENHHGSHFAYLLSKKSLADFTLMAARALGPNVRVNGVCPGIMLPSNELDEDYMKRLSAKLPLGHTATAQQTVEAVLWLATNSAITGQLIYVDGGQHVL